VHPGGAVAIRRDLRDEQERLGHAANGSPVSSAV
jgi:hypothetical protein